MVYNVQEHQFKHASVEDPASIVKFLEALSLGFNEGKLVFSLDDDQVVLEPGGILDF
jgi:amphi-Trp domain-containing protein